MGQKQMIKTLKSLKEYGLSPKKWWEWIIVLLIIAISNIAAISDFYTSIMLGIPYGKVAEASEQARLWQKNFDCIKESKDVLVGRTINNTEIKLSICEGSGDVIVQVTYPDGKSYAKWLSTLSFCEYTNGVQASDRYEFLNNKYAQIMSREKITVEVIFQKMTSDRMLYRRVRIPENNKCFEQMIDIYTGKVIKDKEYLCYECQDGTITTDNSCSGCHIDKPHGMRK